MLPCRCQTRTAQAAAGRTVTRHLGWVGEPTTFCTGSLVAGIWRKLAAEREVNIASADDEVDCSILATADTRSGTCIIREAIDRVVHNFPGNLNVTVSACSPSGQSLQDR